jgi:4-amino-4-deoxy-L-arabinose transferase-like glycosyltransferase
VRLLKKQTRFLSLLDNQQRIFWFLLATVLFSLQVFPRLWTDSAVTDEAWETTSGYYYWLQGDVASPHNHPPTANALNALPLLFMHLKILPGIWNNSENRAYALYYVSNLVQLDWILVLSRAVSLLFSLGTGWILYLFVRRESRVVFLSALGLWAFEPNLLAFSTISKADAPFTFFCAASLFCFLRNQKEKTWKWNFLTGLMTGLAMTSKLTGLCLLPIFLALDFWELREQKWSFSLWVQRWVAGITGFLVVVFFVFLPGTIRLPEHLNPFEYFYLRIKDGLWLAGNFHTSAFFWGQNYPSETLWQFPIIFAMKSTVPFTFLLLVGVAGLGMGKIKATVWVWFFPLAWIVFLHLSPLVYLRYALPAYPAMILLAAQGAGWLWEAGKDKLWRSLRWFLIFAGLWNAASTLSYFSNQIGYFNDFVLSNQKIKLLDYHYFDLDQDLKRLVLVSKERHWTNVKLAYAGQDDPYYYGLPLWEPWSLKDLSAPQAGTVYVIEKHMLLSGSEQFPLYRSWPKVLKPTGFVSDSWEYYEVPGSVKEVDKSPLFPSTPALVYQNALYRRQ